MGPAYLQAQMGCPLQQRNALAESLDVMRGLYARAYVTAPATCED